MRRIFMILATISLLAAAGRDTASAHAFLRRAVPPAGSTLGASPTDVLLTFTEALEPVFSTIEVRNLAGTRVDTGNAGLVDGDGTRFRVGLQKLAPGTYEVVWHAVSVDTHRTDGHFEFTVAP